MGGSGAGGVFDERDIADLREEARRRIEESQAEAAINTRLQQELIYINDRDVELIGGYLDAIQDALSEKGHDIERLRFGGSVAKHTYVDGLSDVDALVILNDESLRGKSPEEVIHGFAESLRQALPLGPVSDIREGGMAVTIVYEDGNEIQLLPAVNTADGVAVSARDGKSWSSIQPQIFAARLTKTNQDQAGKVVPVIKLAKSILTNKLGSQEISGYHLEALAVLAFQNYSDTKATKTMLVHLVEFASRRVLAPVQDVTGQSRYVDEYLGAADSMPRQELSRRLTDVAKRMTNAQSVEDWEQLLE